MTMTRRKRALTEVGLQLVKYLATTGHDYRDILNANYMLLNPWSARSLSNDFSYNLLTQTHWKNINDPNDFEPVVMNKPNWPTVGLLTDNGFMDTYSTTATNRNRKRAHFVYQYFLGLDVLTLSQRPANLNQLLASAAAEPELGAALHEQYVMHRLPQPYRSHGRRMGRLQRQHRFHAAYGTTSMAPTAHTKCLRRVLRARQSPSPKKPTARDGSLRKSPPTHVSHALRSPGGLPFSPRNSPWVMRRRPPRISMRIWQRSTTRPRNFPRLPRISRPAATTFKWSSRTSSRVSYYRGVDLAPGLSSSDATMLDTMVGYRWTGPDALNNKLLATTGTTLLSSGCQWNGWGCINQPIIREYEGLLWAASTPWAAVTVRNESPTGLMVRITTTMASQVACGVVAQDFNKPAAQRTLFGSVSPTLVPDTTAHQQAIQAAIASIYQQVTGAHAQDVAANLADAYTLFTSTVTAGKTASDQTLDGPCQYGTITQDPTYTLKAWIAVMTYILSDPRLVQE